MKTLQLGPAGERWLAFLAVAAALLAASLLFTVPTAVARAGRSEDRFHALEGRAEAGASRERVLRLACEIRDRALDRADYLEIVPEGNVSRDREARVWCPVPELSTVNFQPPQIVRPALGDPPGGS